MDPVAILVDLEQANARLAIERLLEQKSGDPPELDALLIVLGTKALAGDLGLRDVSDVDVLERPVDVGELAELLQQRLGHLSFAGLDAAPSSLGSIPLASESDAALLSDFPAIAGLPEVAGILPELGSAPGMPPTAGELSPEIEALLDASARRVAETDPDVGASPVAADVPVPPEMMSMVDDLLSPEQSPETQGGMSLAAMLGRPLQAPGNAPASALGAGAPSAPGSEPAPPPGSEPSFDSLARERAQTPPPPRPHRRPAVAIRRKPGLQQTSVAEEKTNVPNPSTQVGAPASDYLGSAMATADPEAASSDRSSDTGPPGPYGFGRFLGDPQGAPLSPRMDPVGTEPTPHTPNVDPRLASAVPMTGIPSTAASTLRGHDAMGYAPGRRPSTRPPAGSTPATILPRAPASRASRSPHPRATAPSLQLAASQPARHVAAPTRLLRAARGAASPGSHRAAGPRRSHRASRAGGTQPGHRRPRAQRREGRTGPPGPHARRRHLERSQRSPDDALIVFLVDRGDLSPEVARTRSPRLPHTGRHAPPH